MLARSVFRIPYRSGKNWGAAFFIGGDRLLTCHHVAINAIDETGTLLLCFKGIPEEGLDPWEGKAKLVHSDDRARHDLALLALEQPSPAFVRPLTLADELLVPKCTLQSYGFPAQRAGFGAPGLAEFIGQSRDPDTHQPKLELQSDELTGGFSGAPVITDDTGEAVGVVVATVNPDPRNRFASHCWAIPARTIAVTSPEVEVREPQLLRDLVQFASERAPSLFEYFVGTQTIAPLIEPALRTDKDPEPCSPAQLLKRLGASDQTLMLIEGAGGSGKSLLLRGWLAPLALSQGSPLGREHVPIYVRATSFAAATGPFHERILAALLHDKLVNWSAAPSATDLRLLFEEPKKPMLILVDGLDEIVDPVRRSQVADDFRLSVPTLAKHGHKLVVASRYIGETARLKGLGVVDYQMEGVTEEERVRFLTTLCGEAAPQLLDRFDDVPGLGQLGLPLFLVLIAVTFLETGDVPKSPLEVLERYITIAWNRAPPENRLSLAETTDALAAVALKSTELEELTEQEAIAAIVSKLKDRSASQSAVVLRLAAQETLTMLTSAGLALYRDGPLVRWVHGVFRDYFAGVALMDDLGRNGGRTQAGRWADANFRPVLRFALASLSRETDITPILGGVLGSGSGPPTDAELQFVIDLVLTGAKCPKYLLDDVIDAVVLRGCEDPADYKSCKRLFAPDRHPFELLISVRDIIPGADARIVQLIYDPKLPARVRHQLAAALAPSSKEEDESDGPERRHPQ